MFYILQIYILYYLDYRNCLNILTYYLEHSNSKVKKKSYNLNAQLLIYIFYYICTVHIII